jgi:hypothetical protein
MTPARFLAAQTLVHQASVTDSHVGTLKLISSFPFHWNSITHFDWVVLFELLGLHDPVLIPVLSAGFEQVVASKITLILLIGNLLEKISGYPADTFSASHPTLVHCTHDAVRWSLEVFAGSGKRRYGHVESLSCTGRNISVAVVRFGSRPPLKLR